VGVEWIHGWVCRPRCLRFEGMRSVRFVTPLSCQTYAFAEIASLGGRDSFPFPP
jgi:hypothetical protein